MTRLLMTRLLMTRLLVTQARLIGNATWPD